MSPAEEAAAFHGLATNEALPLTERLGCALKALDLYESEVERLYELTDDAGYRSVTTP